MHISHLLIYVRSQKWLRDTQHNTFETFNIHTHGTLRSFTFRTFVPCLRNAHSSGLPIWCHGYTLDVMVTRSVSCLHTRCHGYTFVTMVTHSLPWLRPIYGKIIFDVGSRIVFVEILWCHEKKPELGEIEGLAKGKSRW